MSQQQQAQDEMSERLWNTYQHILLLNKRAAEQQLEPLDENSLSLVRWAFGIHNH